MVDTWTEAQAWERNWWLNARQCHADEIVKGNLVSKLMLIEPMPDKGVIDIGCGPLSLLLRVPTNTILSAALDPLDFADLEAAYRRAGIRRIQLAAEDFAPTERSFDEAWIYNCLQHVKDPEAVLKVAMRTTRFIRIFEWTFIKPYTGHLHELTPELIERPFREAGWTARLQSTGWLNHRGLDGNYYAGIWTTTA